MISVHYRGSCQNLELQESMLDHGSEGGLGGGGGGGGGVNIN